MLKLISFIFIIGFVVCVISLSVLISIIMNLLRRLIGHKSKSKCINNYIRRR
jgi:hypothetical protein